MLLADALAQSLLRVDFTVCQSLGQSGRRSDNGDMACSDEPRAATNISGSQCCKIKSWSQSSHSLTVSRDSVH